MRPINAHVPKINKAKAFALVKMLRNGAQLTDDQLDQLYVYFSPVRASAPRVKDAFEWVALACGTKDIRPYLHWVTVRGGFMYGADGHRCHRAPTDLADGHYHPATRAPVHFEGYAAPFEKFFNFLASAPVDLRDLERMAVPNGKLGALHCVRVPGGAAVQENYWTEARATSCHVIEQRFVGTSEFGDYTIMGVRLT